jgi:CubicO group peptidase (beta-lactamase class C family)
VDCDFAPGTQGPRQCVEGTVCTSLPGATDECRTRPRTNLSPTLAGFTVNAPGFGAAVFDQEGTIAIGVRGVRKVQTTDALLTTDRFHLGSDTKAMTATLAAVLVEKNLLQWSTKWSTSDPWNDYHRGYSMPQNFTSLIDLLGHRAGVAANPAPYPSDLLLLTEQREQVTRNAFLQAPSGTPGQFLYSNLGYIIAARIMEQSTNSTYEGMMRTSLFRPLGMDSCDFGPSPTVWGHTKGLITRNDGTQIFAFTPTKADNPRVFNSAATAHCSLDDWGKFLREHLRSEGDRSALLPKESYDYMRFNPGTGYRAGWSLTTWKGDLALAHSGSNTLNFALAWVVPARQIAVVAVANSAANDAFGGNVSAQLQAIVTSLLNTYAP